MTTAIDIPHEWGSTCKAAMIVGRSQRTILRWLKEGADIPSWQVSRQLILVHLPSVKKHAETVGQAMNSHHHIT